MSRVALVAAASKGIGLATARRLIADGWRVSICSRDPGSVAAAVSSLGEFARGTACDVTDPEQLARWVDETRAAWGPIGAVVTNTGGPPAGALNALTDAQWQLGVDSTLFNVIRLMRLVEADLIADGAGRVVHVTSLVAVEPSALLPISSTLRAGLVALTRLQARDLARHGVTVNAVLPGHTLTDRQTHLADLVAQRDGISRDEALGRQAARIPAGRLARPDEIAAPIAFLLRPEASYVNGVSLLVDGGLVQGI